MQLEQRLSRIIIHNWVITSYNSLLKLRHTVTGVTGICTITLQLVNKIFNKCHCSSFISIQLFKLFPTLTTVKSYGINAINGIIGFIWFFAVTITLTCYVLANSNFITNRIYYICVVKIHGKFSFVWEVSRKAKFDFIQLTASHVHKVDKIWINWPRILDAVSITPVKYYLSIILVN
jgi:hypothetical protein